MHLPLPGDFIDIHTHGTRPSVGVYNIENLMAHEDRTPEDLHGHACSFGIHPWNLNDGNYQLLLKRVNEAAGFSNLVAIGEAGFDKLKGPSVELQCRAFEAQITVSEDYEKPVVIHCVRAWDELLPVHKRLKPVMPWLIHGFRGKKELAAQLISKGMYISFWFDFVIRPESTDLLKSIPTDRIFLETDGADIDIRDIYYKVAKDLDMSVNDLKLTILKNFKCFFKLTNQGMP